jgi:hypothetical protein
MTDAPLEESDLDLLARIATGNAWLRSALCTLARRGTLLRTRQPERASEIIRRLAPWPWFKAGQFLFDLLEWEDFMVDGPPPPLLPGVLTSENWGQLEDLVAKVRALLQTVQGSDPTAEAARTGLLAQLDDSSLPALEPGLHLYRDVVLGIWMSAATLPVPPASS